MGDKPSNFAFALGFKLRWFILIINKFNLHQNHLIQAIQEGLVDQASPTRYNNQGLVIDWQRLLSLLDKVNTIL